MNYRRSSGINRQLLQVRVSSKKTAAQQQATARRIAMGLLVITISLSVTVLAARVLARKMFYENSQYTIREIRIETDGRAPRAKILELAAVKEGDNLFALDLGEVRSRLEMVPFVKSATVSRVMPDKLLIRVEERKPLARVRAWETSTDGKPHLVELQIDEDAVPVRPRGAISSDLPVIAGFDEKSVKEGVPVEHEGVRAAVKLLKRLQTSRVKAMMDIQAVDVSGIDSLAIRTNDGASLKLLNRFVDGHLDRLEYILAYAQTNSKTIVTADLTVDRNVPVVFKP